MSFIGLPVELSLRIFSLLDFKDILDLSSTSRHLRKVYSRNTQWIYKQRITDLQDKLLRALNTATEDLIPRAVHQQRLAAEKAETYFKINGFGEGLDDMTHEVQIGRNCRAKTNFVRTFYQLSLCALITINAPDDPEMQFSQHASLSVEPVPQFSLPTIARILKLAAYGSTDNSYLLQLLPDITKDDCERIFHWAEVKYKQRCGLIRSRLRREGIINRNYVFEVPPQVFSDDWFPSRYRDSRTRSKLEDEKLDRRLKEIDSHGLRSEQDPQSAWAAEFDKWEYVLVCYRGHYVRRKTWTLNALPSMGSRTALITNPWSSAQ